MAAASSTFFYPSSFECRSDGSGNPKPEKVKASLRSALLRGDGGAGASSRLSSLILRFPPNFVRQLSIKARRNCSNIGVAQIVAASWSNPVPPPSAVDGAAAAAAAIVVPVNDEGVTADSTAASSACNSNNNNDTTSGVQLSSGFDKYDESFIRSPGSLAIHAALDYGTDLRNRYLNQRERLGRGIVTDAITTPIVQTSAYKFKNTAELLSFKACVLSFFEGTFTSFEYGRYGNPTTEVAENKISALEGAESTLLMASGMNAAIVMMMALVPAGGHIVTTTDCYRKTRIFIQTILPKMGITATIIDPADMDALKSALDQHDVSLFFTESPTNPFLRCVDIELVSKLCHSKGTLVCIDGTFATPINQKALALGADMVLQSATKYLAGHNDVIAGCISGSKKLISTIRTLHHVMGGVINPNASYGIIRGMKTLHLRVQQQNSTALRMAQILEAHPKWLPNAVFRLEDYHSEC
ncbi:cAMP-dependent protein kinase regulatory subunit Cgs1 [Asimina triloba]